MARERFQGPFSHRVVEPDGTTFEMETGPGSANWTPLQDISPFLVQAVLGHEDGGFFRHEGFSPFSIRQLKPIQMPNMDMDELKRGRGAFSAEEWLLKPLPLSR